MPPPRILYDAAVKEKSVVEEREARRNMVENSSPFVVLNKSAGETKHGETHVLI